jgi:hypothetical protein
MLHFVVETLDLEHLEILDYCPLKVTGFIVPTNILL